MMKRNQIILQLTLVLDKNTVLPNNQVNDDRLEFTELPEELSLTRTANYIDIDIIGRSEPLKSYANSPSTVFDFSVKFVAVGDPVAAGVGLSNLSKFSGAAVASGNEGGVAVAQPSGVISRPSPPGLWAEGRRLRWPT